MKRVGGLWDELSSFSNLLGAAEAAAAGKRRRLDVASFLMELEPNLCTLRRELLEGSYRPGEYRSFEILYPKRRQISAAPFRDRVVHHALTRMLEPVFESRFSPYSFACRRGYGVHAALRLARDSVKRYRYVLKCDVRKYFASIDHEILKAKLARVVKCRKTLELAGTIIDGSNTQEELLFYFAGDDLFTPQERRRGLPLGNQTSQFFANLYLNGLDHAVRKGLAPGNYARYVDDFVIFGDCKERLRAMREEVKAWLEQDRLLLHEGKSRLYRCQDGVSFLGWRLFPSRTRLVRENVMRCAQRMRELETNWNEGKIAWDTVRQSVAAWIGHASFGDTAGLRQRMMDRYGFAVHGGGPSRGGAGRVLQQQCEEPARVEP
jgi:RNA-directed DNA polymerase